jgi:hypothetical protein
MGIKRLLYHYLFLPLLVLQTGEVEPTVENVLIAFHAQFNERG